MKTKLLTIALFLCSYAYGQFGSDENYEIQRLKPLEVISIKDTVPDLFTEIEVFVWRTGLTSNKLIFRSFGKKISENDDIMGSNAASFFDNNSKYVTLAFDQNLKSYIFGFIDVPSGKTITKVKFQPPFYKTLLLGKIHGTQYIHVGNSKSKEDNFITLVDCNTGNILNKIDISALRIGANAVFEILSDDYVLIAQDQDKKIKTFDPKIASNLVLVNLKTGDTEILMNKIFTDNGNKPKNLYYDNESRIYVSYNDYKPFIVVYDLTKKDALFEIKEPKGDMGKTIHCITPDNKFIFLNTRDVIDVWSIDEKKRVRIVSADPSIPVPYTKLKISPDGTKLSAVQVGFNSYGLEAKDNLSVWSISSLTK